MYKLKLKTCYFCMETCFLFWTGNIYNRNVNTGLCLPLVVRLKYYINKSRSYSQVYFHYLKAEIKLQIHEYMVCICECISCVGTPIVVVGVDLHTSFLFHTPCGSECLCGLFELRASRLSQTAFSIDESSLLKC